MAHFDVLKKFMIILKMCLSVNQIDDLQRSNKKKSWAFHLPRDVLKRPQKFEQSF